MNTGGGMVLASIVSRNMIKGGEKSVKNEKNAKTIKNKLKILTVLQPWRQGWATSVPVSSKLGLQISRLSRTACEIIHQICL